MDQNANHSNNKTGQKKRPEDYDRAILLIQSQVQLLWLIFGAFLLSETVLLGSIASIDMNNSRNLVFWVSIFGVILSLLWLSTFFYNHAFYRLRIEEAKLFEPSEGKFFDNGYKLHKGDRVAGIKIPRLIRWFRPKTSLTILIILYLLVFMTLACISCPIGN
jgi:hypothetical protein